MTCGLLKQRPQPSRLCKYRKGTLDAVAKSITGSEPSPSPRDTKSTKKRFDAASEIDQRPTKKARLKTTKTQTGFEKTEQTQHLCDLAQDVQSAKRKFEPTPTANPLPPKRVRTGARQSCVAKENPEQVDKATLHYLKPESPKFTNALSFESEPESSEQAFPAGDNYDNKSHSRSTLLTRKNLARFDRMRKRGTNKASASTPPYSTDGSLTARTTSTTSSGFAIQAYKNGMYDPFSSKPPINIGDMRKRNAASRRTASPTESDHKRYVNTVGSAVNEATMVVKMSGKMLKEYDDECYQQAYNQAFTGFPKEAGFNNGLSAPQPDFVEGLRMQDFEPFPIDERIDGAVLYKDNPNSLTLPHLAGEWKKRGKDMEQATLQSAYDGAALVYTREQALSYLGKTDPPGHAEITTFTTDGTNLNFYAHYAALSEDGTRKYHQYLITSSNLVKSRQEHNEGRRGLRNQQDYARQQSYNLRDQLQEHWKKQSSSLHHVSSGIPLPDTTETALHEDEASYEIAPQPCQPTPTALHSSSSKSRPSSHVSATSRQKRKASLSPRGSSNGFSKHKDKYKSYWTRDTKSGRYFHRHSDGGISWLDEDDEED